MTNIVIVTGSVRPNSVNAKVVAYVKQELGKQPVNVTVADLGELNLPFFNDISSPSNPDFAPTNEAVKQWTNIIDQADGVILVTPEYNHTMSPVQLNAVDWISKEWNEKPVSLIGYGWSGAHMAHATAREVLAVNLKANVLDTQANLSFMKDLSPAGEITDTEQVLAAVTEVVNELVAAATK